MTGNKRKWPCVADDWRDCCGSCARCGGVCLRATSCCYGLEPPRKKRAGPSASSRFNCLAKDQTVTGDTFRFRLNKDKLKQAEHRDGYYLLRSNLSAEDPTFIWTLYVQLTQIEAVFRSLKSELDIRPIYHQKEDRIDAHIFLAF